MGRVEGSRAVGRTSTPRRALPSARLLAAIFLPAILFAGLARNDRAGRDQRLSEAMEYTIQVGAEQALRLIEGGINALDRAEDATITLTWPQIQQRRQTLQAEFRRLDEAQPDLVAGLALARPDGRIVVTDSAVNPDAIATPQRLAAAEGLRTARRGTLSFDPPPAEGFGAHAGLLLSRPRKIEGRPADGVLSAALREEPFLRAWTTAARDLPDAPKAA